MTNASKDGSDISSGSRTGAAVGIDDVLDAWFGDDESGRRDLPQGKRWFSGSEALDARLRTRFGDAIEAAARGELDAWRETPEGALALIVLLDQFTRNVHRGTARAFAHDGQALAIAEEGVARGNLERLPPVQAVFHVLPFEHDESRASQHRALALLKGLAADAPAEVADFMKGALESAEEHAAIVERFGRYPYRNAVLGRESTPEEEAWLAGGAKSFGQ